MNREGKYKTEIQVGAIFSVKSVSPSDKLRVLAVNMAANGLISAATGNDCLPSPRTAMIDHRAQHYVSPRCAACGMITARNGCDGVSQHFEINFYEILMNVGSKLSGIWIV